MNYFLRHSPTANQESNLIKEYIKNDPKASLIYMNDDYGVAFERKCEERLNNRIIAYEKTRMDFSVIVTKAKQLNPSKIIICGAGKGAAEIIIN